MICSIHNPQIKNIIQLQKKARQRAEQGVFLVEGKKMVQELSSEDIVKIYVSQYSWNSFWEANLKVARDKVEQVSDAVFQKISDTVTPQGILAIVKQKEYRLSDLLQQKRVQLLLLEDIRDPGNLGTMIRTAEGAGITGVLCNATCVDYYHPKVVRATMGSILRVPLLCVSSLLETMQQLKKYQIMIYAAHLKGSVVYDTISYSSQCAILVGNEANGLTEKVAAHADACIRIPMEGKVESLNASIATGILLYEIQRQNRTIH